MQLIVIPVSASLLTSLENLFMLTLIINQLQTNCLIYDPILIFLLYFAAPMWRLGLWHDNCKLCKAF